jgi:hypothetical protein
MQKTFYYIVPWKVASDCRIALSSLGIPYWVETSSKRFQLDEGEIALVLPDLPVWDLAAVMQLMGGEPLDYR